MKMSRNKPLPIEYTPLSLANLPEKKVFGPVPFEVKASSHVKTVGALLGSVQRRAGDEDQYPLLLPSELWGWARVLSKSFGRLNEVGVSRTVWEFHGSAAPETSVLAKSTVVGSARRGKVAYCDILTETCEASSGRLLMRATDGFFLTHDCDKPFYTEPAPSKQALPGNLLYDNQHRVYFRFPWDLSVWVNNIHTDRYAQQCGFERGLPEFVTYADWIYHAAVKSGWTRGRPFALHLARVLPIYFEEVVRVVAWPEADVLQFRFLRDEMERVVASVKLLP